MARDLNKGSAFKNIVFFSIPFLFSYFLQTLYGLADLFISGQFNGADIISAVSIGSQIMHMLTVVIVGLSMGSTVIIGRAAGAKEEKTVSKAVGNTAAIFIIFSILLTVILNLSVNGIVKIMSTPSEAVAQTKLYLSICFLGIPFITAYNIISSVYRGIGDSKSPMYFIIVSCVLNIVLDYVFIGGFGLKAAGAALGTVLSQTVSVIFALIYTKKKDVGIHLTKKDFIPDREMFKNILTIGVPIALQDGFIQVSFIVITIIANRRGVEVAAAVGIVEKIIGFLFLIPSSMLSAVSSITSQNMGAGQHDRAKQTLKYGILIGVCIGAFFAVTFQFLSAQAVSLFTKDSNVVVLGSQYLRSYVFDCAIAGITFAFSGYFCAYGLAYVSFIHNCASILLVRIPGAYFASKFFPDTLFPMGIASPTGSLLSAIICISVYIYISRKNTAKEFAN